MNIWDLTFPVFLVCKEGKLITEGTLIKHQSSFGKISVVDDISLSGNLSVRRLQLRVNTNIEIKDIGLAIYLYKDLLKSASNTSYFIDNTGKTFKYKKTRLVPLVFRKIKKVQRISPFKYLVWVHGVPYPFTTLYTPGQEYVGLLKLGRHFILYGIFDQKYDDTIRKI